MIKNNRNIEKKYFLILDSKKLNGQVKDPAKISENKKNQQQD